MKYTSAEAAKLLRELNEQRSSLLQNEELSREFVASIGEDVEAVRPAYDFSDMQRALDEVESKIRLLKHTINVFNATHTVPGFDMTIDQMLIYIPQLTARREKLSEMKNRLPKTRQQAAGFGRANAVIDYVYANYDIPTVAREYDVTARLLARVQTALDLVNSTETMEIEL